MVFAFDEGARRCCPVGVPTMQREQRLVARVDVLVLVRYFGIIDGAGFNPVTYNRFREIRSVDNVLKDATVPFDRSDRADIVIVAGHQNALDTEFLTRN